MKVAFRVDASLKMGSGHVMRCLTLADELQREGAESLFMCREMRGDLINFIESRGYPVLRLKIQTETFSSWHGDASQCIQALFIEGCVDWLIVDSYFLSAPWETMLRSVARKIFVIDDLANRIHDCDIILDQNYYVSGVTRYDNLIPDGCCKLLGPRYSLVRKEFLEARAILRKRDGHIRRILVFFGGCDAGNETLKALNAIRIFNHPEILVDVIVGSQNPYRDELNVVAASVAGMTTHHNVSNMAEFIAASDLYVGAAGTTTWERCCLGLPSLVITVAANQVETTVHLHQLGVLSYLGDSRMVTAEQLSLGIKECTLFPERMKVQSEKGLTLVDGYGAEYCTDIITKYFN